MAEVDEKARPAALGQTAEGIGDKRSDQKFSELREWLHAEKESLRPEIEVSFSGLKCYGFLSSAQYQATFFSVLTRPFQTFFKSCTVLKV